jgi:carbon-monoxide dehydrogenase large subunit
VTDAYRGAGRPEAAYYLERAVDALAAKLEMDPAELRKLNYVKPEQFPFPTAVGMVMDSGQYEATLDRLLEMADIPGLREEQERALQQGRHLGIGLTTYVENCGLAPSAMFEGGFSWAGLGLPSAFNESAVVRANPDGSVTVVTGTGPTGQGHETTWAQIAADTLGVSFDKVEVRHGDTNDSPMGIGTFGSRSAAVGGPAVARASGRVQEKAAKIAAHLLEAAAEDMRFEDGKVFVAGSPEQSVSWEDVVAAAYQQYRLPEGVEAGLEDIAFFDPTNATWPYGAHLAVVEVDPETGNVDILRYLAVDDCGVVINPMIVEGQIQGGIVQGIGQAMFEEAVYDEQGSLLTASLADYLLPTASDVPSFEMDRTVTPTDSNPLGIKGIGEAGTIGSAQTIVAAVLDALRPMGVTTIDMPLRPKKVWQAIQDAKGGEG